MVSSIGTSTAWPSPVRSRCSKRRHHRIDHGQADRLVADQGRDKPRLAAGRLFQRDKAARPLDDVVKSGAVGERPILTVAMRRAIDEAAVDLAQHVVGEAEPRHRLGAHIMQEDIAAADQREQHLAGLGAFQIKAQRAFVAIEVQENMAHLAVPRRAGKAHDVAPRRFDLDHLGAEIAQDLRRKRPQYHGRQVDDLDPGKRAGFGRRSGRRHQLSLDWAVAL